MKHNKKIIDKMKNKFTHINLGKKVIIVNAFFIF